MTCKGKSERMKIKKTQHEWIQYGPMVKKGKGGMAGSC